MMRIERVVAAALAGVVVAGAVGETLTVCAEGCEFTSIQAAVDAASDGDVIQLADETYSEGGEIRVEGKVLSIVGERSSRGEPLTVVMGNGTHRLLRFVGIDTEGGVVVNISFQLGRELSGNDGGAGILADSPIAVRNCEFVDNQAGEGILQSYGGGSRGPIHHEGCLFLNNRAFYGGGSYGGTYGQCDFIGNGSSTGLGVAAAPKGAAVYNSQYVEDCMFTGNAAYSTVASANLYGCVFLDGVCLPNGAEVVNCRFEGRSRLDFCDWSDCCQTATVIGCYFESTIGRPCFGSVFQGCHFEGEGTMFLLGGKFEDCVINTGATGSQISSEGGPCADLYEPCFENCTFREACPADPAVWHDLGGNRFAGEMHSSCPLEYCNTWFAVDGRIDASSLGRLLERWGYENYCDIDGDRVIGPAELGELLASWGQCR